MSKRLIILFSASFLLISLIILSFIYIQHRKLNHISCNAFYIAKNSEAKLLSKNHLEINDEIGSWMMDGKVNIDNKKPYYFKLRARFSVKRIGYVYYITNNNVMINPNELSEEKVLQGFLAEILRIENTQSFFTITPIKDNYVIYSGETPVMYCINSKL